MNATPTNAGAGAAAAATAAITGTSAAPTHDLRLHAAAAPERTAIIFGAQRWSYAATEALANRMAAVWRSLGLVRGDHVAVLLSNRAEILAAAWAAWRCGVYFTPMSTALTAPELRYLIEDCGAKVVLADGALHEVAARLPALVNSAPHWLSLDALDAAAAVDATHAAHADFVVAAAVGVPGSAAAAGASPSAIAIDGYTRIEPLLQAASPRPLADEPPGALMLYTSGTTGAPKGVHRPLLPPEYRGTPPFAGDLIGLFGLAGENVRYLSTAPLYHAAGLRFALAVTAGGGTVVVMPRFHAAQALALLEAERITVSQWVPAMFQRLLELPEERRARFAAPTHRMAIHAAAPCPQPLKRRMIDWWGPILQEYYAGSEGVGLTMLDSHEWLRKPGSVGRAHRGTLHIVSPEGADLPAGETGLVCFSGLPPFSYHKAPEKTAARTLAQGDRVRQTLGDIGHVDAEGYLFLTDRADDMIISGGVNVYPQEIEAAILQVPGVAECAVVGVPDLRFGERPVACVVATHVLEEASGAQRGEAPDAAALTEAVRLHCERVLGRIKRPDRIVLVQELPRLPTGKLLRRKLREAVVGA